MALNLGARVAGAFAALSGALSADVAANTAADASFREQTEAALAAAGAATTALKAQVDDLATRVENGETVDPAEFAKIKEAVDSLDAAFPDVDGDDDDADDDESGVE